MIDPFDFDDLPDEVLDEISNPDFDWEDTELEDPEYAPKKKKKMRDE